MKTIRIAPHCTDRSAGRDQKVLEVSVRGTDMTAVGCVLTLTRAKRKDGKETLRIDVGNVREHERGRVRVVLGANIDLPVAPPGLLEALKILLVQVKPYEDGDGAAMFHAQNIAREAVAKAEKGETP